MVLSKSRLIDDAYDFLGGMGIFDVVSGLHDTYVDFVRFYVLHDILLLTMRLRAWLPAAN